MRKSAKKKNTTPLVSLHGGHSADFCLHAMDPLEKIVQRYADLGYSIVGLTEHMPPCDNSMRYPDEVEAGIDAEQIQDRFRRYFETARRLAKEHAPKMRIYVGFETEWYENATPFIKEMIDTHNPDYIVGSVHHVGGIPFDYNEDTYMEATAYAGGLDELYQCYFDTQFDMLNALSPPVVGHFDLIRLFDPDYPRRLLQPEIHKRIARNLELIKEQELILDLNTRAYMKGATEPYPSLPILEMAKELGIGMAPSDDSHGVDSAGYKIEHAIHLLRIHGFDTDWRRIENHLSGFRTQ